MIRVHLVCDRCGDRSHDKDGADAITRDGLSLFEFVASFTGWEARIKVADAKTMTYCPWCAANA